MNESILDLLTKVTLYDLIWATILIVAIIVVLIAQKQRIHKLLNKWRKVENEKEDFEKLVYSLKNSVEEIKKTTETFQKNRESDREDSLEIRKEIYKSIDNQSEVIQKLVETVIKIQEKNSKTKRAEIKEKIERIYRECHPTGICTDMQLDTLKELIEEYEEHGGLNSFVHSVVEIEMYEWQVIDRIPTGSREVIIVEEANKRSF